MNKLKLPKIQTYGKYNTHDKNRNCIILTIKNLQIYFSNNDIIAFNYPETGLEVKENKKGNVIEKHFKWIDGGIEESIQRRIKTKSFNKKLNKICEKEGLI